MVDSAERVRAIVRVAEFSALIAVGSLLVVPLGPVPITLQTMILCLAGLCLGPKLGLWAVLLYILAGALGLPVFAGGKAGLGVLLGPTGGYLLGFPLLAFCCGLAKGRGNMPARVALMLLGLLLTHLLGMAGMAWSLHRDFMQVLIMDAAFLPGDIVKALGALLIWRFFLSGGEQA